MKYGKLSFWFVKWCIFKPFIEYKHSFLQNAVNFWNISFQVKASFQHSLYSQYFLLLSTNLHVHGYVGHDVRNTFYVWYLSSSPTSEPHRICCPYYSFWNTWGAPISSLSVERFMKCILTLMYVYAKNIKYGLERQVYMKPLILKNITQTFFTWKLAQLVFVKWWYHMNTESFVLQCVAHFKSDIFLQVPVSTALARTMSQTAYGTTLFHLFKSRKDLWYHFRRRMTHFKKDQNYL